MTTITATNLSGLPDEIEIGYLRLEFQIEDRTEAVSKTKALFAQITSTFAVNNRRLAFLYDLDFEVGEPYRGSWIVPAKASLKLKKRWKHLKSAMPGPAIALSMALASIAGYPNLKHGAYEFYQDAKHVTEYVLDENAKLDPVGAPKCDFQPAVPPDDHDGEGVGMA